MKPYEYILLILLAAYAAFPIFMHLGERPIMAWDESFYAMRALHLAEEGELLRNFSQYEGCYPQPNMKPPLVTLFQAATMKVLGKTLLALRLPTSIFVLACLGLLVYYARKETGNILVGVLAGAVLVTMEGFMLFHVGRSGDHDAALSFFVLWSALHFYSNAKKGNFVRGHWWQVLILTLAFQTKLVMGLFLLPAFFIFLIIEKKIGAVLRHRSTYLQAAFFLIVNVGLIYYYDTQIPDFIDNLLGHSTFGRFTTSVNYFYNPAWFYPLNWWEGRMQPWLWVLLASPFIFFTNTKKTYTKWAAYAWLCFGTILGVITLSKTKTFWYDAMLYPFVSMIAAIIVTVFFERFLDLIKKENLAGWTLGGLLLASVFIYPYGKILSKIYHQKNEFETEDCYAYFLEKAAIFRPDEKTFKLYNSGFGGHAAFYTHLYNQKKYDINIIRKLEEAQSGDKVLICGSDKAVWEKEFLLEVWVYDKPCALYIVTKN